MINIYQQKKSLPRFSQDGFILLVMLLIFILESSWQLYYWRSEQQAVVLMGQLCGRNKNSCFWGHNKR